MPIPAFEASYSRLKSRECDAGTFKMKTGRCQMTTAAKYSCMQIVSVH